MPGAACLLFTAQISTQAQFFAWSANGQPDLGYEILESINQSVYQSVHLPKIYWLNYIREEITQQETSND